MSLFDDDFYSTKVHRGWRWPAQYGSPFMRGKEKWLIASIAAAAGALIMLLIVSLGRDSGDQVVRVVEKVKPAVVSVVSQIQGISANGSSGMGLGSGVIFQKSGDKARIVTNNHVVDGAAQIHVVLSGGERKPATIVGKDALSDLAVLEVDASGITQVAQFGDSGRVKAGETVIAVGNPLGLGHSPTITVGVISSPLRTIPVSLSQSNEPDWELDVIQTDAAINQGNSGGALVNLQGKVIGINSLKVSYMGVEGMGFAIPSNKAKPVIESLIKDRKVRRPFMGVTSQNLQSFGGIEALNLPDMAKTGVIVLEVTGPAAEAGLQSNDVIVALDDQPVNNMLELRKYLYARKSIGEKLKVTFYRDGKKETVTLTLGEMPAE